jgi:hypothetical protein
MQQHVGRVFACVVAATVIFLGGLMFAQGQPGAKQPAQTEKGPGASVLRRTPWLVEIRNQPIDTKDFQAPNMTVAEFLKILNGWLKNWDPDIAILVDVEAFKKETPDVYTKESDWYDQRVKIPAEPRRLNAVTLLRTALDQLPTKNATFVLRRGLFEITTTARATPHALAQEKVLAAFERVPLAVAVEELSLITGASVVFDPRVGDKRNTAVTATFLNDVSLRTALGMMADMADLRVVMLEQGLYLTTPEHADALRKEQKARQEEQLWRKQMELPEPGETAPSSGKRDRAAASNGRRPVGGVPVARSPAAEPCSPLHGCPYPGSGISPLFKQSPGGF